MNLKDNGEQYTKGFDGRKEWRNVIKIQCQK